jgi:endogenous inhibitor of DNA gyrase (YacG/DUF329 family)
MLEVRACQHCGTDLPHVSRGRPPRFCSDKCRNGRDALGYYHEKKDEARDVGLGPEHDWSSHAADAFGLMAIKYEEPSRMANFHRKIVYPQLGIVGNKAGNRTFDGLSVLG